MYPTSYILGGAAPTGNLTVVFSEASSADLRASYLTYCQPQRLDYSDCSNALTKVIGSQPSISKRFIPAPVSIVITFIGLCFLGVASYLSSSGNAASTTPISVTIPPSALPTADPGPVTNEIELTCWAQKDCTEAINSWSYRNLASTTSPACYSQKNCQCITYNSTNVNVQVWNGHDCTGRSSYAYAASGCDLARSGQATTAGTNSLQFIPVC